MGERNDRGAVAFEADADAVGEAGTSEQPPHGQTADRHDQLRPDQLELPLAPERAQLLLARRRRPVALATACSAGIAARDRGAVERGVEFALLQVEPAAKCLTRLAAPRPPLASLDRAGRLAEHVRALPLVRLHDRQRLERVPGFDAGAADAGVSLERPQRAVARAAARH